MKIRLHLTKRCSHVLYVIVTQCLPHQNRPQTKYLPRHIRRGHYNPKTIECLYHEDLLDLHHLNGCLYLCEVDTAMFRATRNILIAEDTFNASKCVAVFIFLTTHFANPCSCRHYSHLPCSVTRLFVASSTIVLLSFVNNACALHSASVVLAPNTVYVHKEPPAPQAPARDSASKA